MNVDLDLTAVEARVVGCLIEKEATTPDGYPLTTNALVTACNQKTNRDPVVQFSAIDVDGALLSLRQKGLVRAVNTPGSRTTKHRHVVPEAVDLPAGAIAVLAVLLLRGAQTVGELRARTERIHAFEDLDAVERALMTLTDHEPSLVVQLDRAPGQKEARWLHLMTQVHEGVDPAVGVGAAPAAPSSAAAHHAAPVASPTHPTDTAGAPPATASVPSPAPMTHPGASPAAGPSAAAPGAGRPTGSEGRVAALEAEVAALRRELDELRGRFDALADSLGWSDPSSAVPSD